MKVGQIFTIEPSLCEGEAEGIMFPDGWTVGTADWKRSAQFEHTVSFPQRQAKASDSKGPHNRERRRYSHTIAYRVCCIIYTALRFYGLRCCFSCCLVLLVILMNVWLDFKQRVHETGDDTILVMSKGFLDRLEGKFRFILGRCFNLVRISLVLR